MSTPLSFRYSYLFLLLAGLVLPAQAASNHADNNDPHQEKPPTDFPAQLRQRCRADSLLCTDAVTRQMQEFYASVAYSPVWTSAQGPTASAQAALELLLNAQRYGLPATEYSAVGLQRLLLALPSDSAQSGQRLAAEMQLTKALLLFTRHLSRGRIEDLALRPVQTTDEVTFDAAAHVHQALRSAQFAPHLLTAQPTSRSYVRLLFAWQQLLKTDTAAARKMALPVALNLERLRWEPRPDSVYLVVNIPAYSLQVVRGPQVVRSYRVVVGKTSTPTPELYSKLSFFQAAPEWRMPYSIATNEILPHLKCNPNYLATKHFRLYDQADERVNAARVNWTTVTPANFPYQIRQAPSYRNALGTVVFRFANPYEIYLHDTPNKKAFLADYRALSHGCIRVQHAPDLARFLLLRDGGTDGEKRVRQLDNSIDAGDTKAFALRAAVPLLVRYQTCDADGKELRLLPDIYRRDVALAKAWEQASLPLISVAVSE